MNRWIIFDTNYFGKTKTEGNKSNRTVLFPMPVQKFIGPVRVDCQYLLKIYLNLLSRFISRLNMHSFWSTQSTDFNSYQQIQFFSCFFSLTNSNQTGSVARPLRIEPVERSCVVYSTMYSNKRRWPLWRPSLAEQCM